LFANPDHNRRFYIYRHLRTDTNEVFYVGRGVGSRYRATYGRNIVWHRVVEKCGSFVAQKILENLTLEEAKEKEKEFVAIYGRKDSGLGTLVNLTDGGDGMYNYNISDRTRKLLSDIKINNPVKFWSGKARPELQGENNHKSKRVVNTDTKEMYYSARLLLKSLKDSGIEVKYSTAKAWLSGKNTPPEWFTYRYA